MLDVYTDATPNGLKGLDRPRGNGPRLQRPSDLARRRAVDPRVHGAHPNNKIPVLVDDGLVVTESGAILPLSGREDRQIPA